MELIYRCKATLSAKFLTSILFCQRAQFPSFSPGTLTCQFASFQMADWQALFGCSL
jgi:hypothetical protein